VQTEPETKCDEEGGSKNSILSVETAKHGATKRGQEGITSIQEESDSASEHSEIKNRVGAKVKVQNLRQSRENLDEISHTN
jgi:hypothetical protein